MNISIIDRHDTPPVISDTLISIKKDTLVGTRDRRVELLQS